MAADGGIAQHPFVGYRDERNPGKSLSWRIATVLGNFSDPAVDERWEWFAHDPDDPRVAGQLSAGWHQDVIDNCSAGLEPWLDLLLRHKEHLGYLYADNPHLNLRSHAEATLLELLYFGRGDGFAALRARAEELYRSGIDGCRRNDDGCEWGTTEWITDFVLDHVVGELVLQGVYVDVASPLVALAAAHESDGTGGRDDVEQARATEAAAAAAAAAAASLDAAPGGEVHLADVRPGGISRAVRDA